MDLTLADIVVFDEDYTTHLPFAPLLIDPRDQETIDKMFSKPVRLPAYIPPHTRALLSTSDVVTIPPGVIGVIGLRSTWARLGFVSPMTIADPGFSGTLTMELWNASPQKILVRPGDKVWTIHKVVLYDQNSEPYKGRYQGQTVLQIPKAIPDMVMPEQTDIRTVDGGADVRS